MGSAEWTEWWVDESSLPNVIFARLRMSHDGSADVYDCDGRTYQFPSTAEAMNSLLEDEYAPLRSIDRSELSRLGIRARDLVPPDANDARALLDQMRRFYDGAELFRDLEAVTWLKPWVLLASHEYDVFERELARELPPAHPLYGRDARAALRRIDRDDVLFVVSAPPQLAVLHLTFTSRPADQPPWPTFEMYEQASLFVDRMHKDAADYEAG